MKPPLPFCPTKIGSRQLRGRAGVKVPLLVAAGKNGGYALEAGPLSGGMGVPVGLGVGEGWTYGSEAGGLYGGGVYVYPGLADGDGEENGEGMAGTGVGRRVVIDFIPIALPGPQPIGVKVSSTTPITAMVRAVSATAATTFFDPRFRISAEKLLPMRVNRVRLSIGYGAAPNWASNARLAGSNRSSSTAFRAATRASSIRPRLRSARARFL